MTLQVIAPDRDTGEQVLDRVRALSAEHSVYRGQVISLGGDGPAASGGQPAFLDRPAVARSQVVLPGDLLDGIERQILGIARHSQTLLANGQHLKRGVLLHGAPGTGKSHTVRYLLSQLPGVTAILLTGSALAFIGEACEMARALQPAVVVVEDVDLIAAQRRPGSPPHPLLIQLLGEMDGTGADADVAFLLTTSRADLLEEALAGRPGRVDHTARLPLPDAAARRRLLRVYQGNLQFSRPTAAAVVARTDGVTASFMKELLRRAALHAAARPARAGGGAGRRGAGSAAPGDRPALQPGPGRAAGQQQPASRGAARRPSRPRGRLGDPPRPHPPHPHPLTRPTPTPGAPPVRPGRLLPLRALGLFTPFWRPSLTYHPAVRRYWGILPGSPARPG